MSSTMTEQAVEHNYRLQSNNDLNRKELDRLKKHYCPDLTLKGILWYIADQDSFDDEAEDALKKVLVYAEHGEVPDLFHYDCEGSAKSVIHKAVAEKKTAFLNSLLSLLENDSFPEERISTMRNEVVRAIRKQDENQSDSTCLHTAIQGRLACVIKMVELCASVELDTRPESYNAMLQKSTHQHDDNDQNNHDKSILFLKDNKNNTVLHLLLESLGTTQRNAPIRRGNRTEIMQYDSMDVIDKIEELYQPIMRDLLLAINVKGFSPYKALTETLERARKVSKSDRVDATAKDREIKAAKQRADLQERIKSKIFKSLSDIPDLKKALYGTKSQEKELSLDMSDFNRSSHDFKEFVKSLTHSEAKNLIEFEECLVSVFLADLNTFKKPVPYDGVDELFQWLKEKGNVKKIKSLNIPDNTSIPMSDEYVLVCILERFEIERFDWRKLDINLDILLSSPHKDAFTHITLYSTGNFSVLYHWASKDGIGGLPNLRNLTIEIISPNTINQPDAVQRKHQVAIEKYHQKLQEMLKERKMEKETQKRKEGDRKFIFEFKINPGRRWDFPAPRFIPQRSDEIQKLELIQRMEACRQFLMNMGSKPDCLEFIESFKKHDRGAMQERDEEPECVKVAIIDNGADKFQYPICDCIERGISYVTADNNSTDRVLPWWMVSDPHGTQMASLVREANPWCQLYIARVGKGRRDILPQDAAQAIKWAIEQKVDIISISWVIKSQVSQLEQAIKSAVQNGILVFCSTADTGTGSGSVYPAYYQGTVRVSATDKYGNLMPSADKRTHAVNIPVPGEDIPAVGPSYMSDGVAEGTVSGSSVATALAAGMASLSLLLLMVFNNKDKQALKREGFYENEKMGKLLSMGINTPADTEPLFPNAAKINDLPRRWKLSAIMANI